MIFAILLGFLLAVNAKQITVEVQGRFNCTTNRHDVPVHIELRERDLMRDDLLGWTSVKPQNYFQLKGTENEYFYINPYLVIMHTCNGHHEKVMVNFGHIYKDIVVNFGDQDLEDIALQSRMEEKINEQMGRFTTYTMYDPRGIFHGMKL